MKISQVKATPIGIDFKAEYKHDNRYYFKPEKQVNVIVEIVTDEGIVGYGEAAHAPGVFGETWGATMGAISYFTPRLVGQDPLDVTRLEVELDRISPIGNIAAKAAIDMALYDVAGKISRLPVYQLLGGLVHPKLRSSITPATFEGTAKALAGLKEQGFRVFKQKMSGDIDWDIRLVKDLLPLLDEDILITLDTNQGWTLTEALKMARFVESSQGYKQNVVLEQPISASNVRGLARIRNATSVRVLADDGIRTMANLLEVLDSEAADIVSLKVSRVGGIGKCARMIAIAEAYEVDYSVEEITEMRIANTAVAHLAAASRRPLYTCVTCHLLLEEDVVREGGVEIIDGCSVLPDSPGLGIVALDPDVMAANRVA